MSARETILNIIRQVTDMFHDSTVKATAPQKNIRQSSAVSNTPELLPLRERYPRSGYVGNGEFEKMAKRCSMGDVKAMLWMFYKLRERLSEEYKAKEAAYLEGKSEGDSLVWLDEYLETHKEDSINFLGANMWLNRAALYGSEEAKRIRQSTPLYRRAYFSMEFQSRGEEQRWKDCQGEDLRRIGLLDFTENRNYCLEPLNEEGIYVASYYVDYDSGDETGFGMEDYDNYFFFDEFFCILFMLKEWSSRSIRINQDRIVPTCKRLREEKQARRDEYWKHLNDGQQAERYHRLMTDRENIR